MADHRGLELSFSLSMQPLVSAWRRGTQPSLLKPPEKHGPAAPGPDRRSWPVAISDQLPCAVVEGDGDTARQLLENDFDHIFFTAAAGSVAGVMAARRPPSHPVHAGMVQEPAWLLSDADLAVHRPAHSPGVKGLPNAGQAPASPPTHLLVK